MNIDLLMLLRETIFLLLAIPMIVFSFKCLIELRRRKIAASRIFLKEEEVSAAFRNLFLASISAFPASITLFLWSIFRLELLRLITAILFIIFIAFILISSYELKKVLAK
ncbi:MAG TPA: hypothetical protein ENF33_04710 [Nitrososphaeria archaeon]|nr:hypothetical protein [Nitrososphaeria archaeon]